MKSCNIAVLGATGAVGREMLKVLEEYDIPVSRLRALSSARSAGSTVPFRGGEIVVEEATDASFEGMDFVLGAVKSTMSRAFAPAIVKSGAVFIDNSSAFRMDAGVPLVVPEINGEDARHSAVSPPSSLWSPARTRRCPAPGRAVWRSWNARWRRSDAARNAKRRYSPRRSRSTLSRSSAASSIISTPTRK